jgi:SAM-dependent methyltransferase
MTLDYQDVLAALGAGSAHPGGFQTTLEWMKHVPLDASSRVLDVGCGTGQTLLHLKREFGCDVTGVDIRREMLAKTRRRARHAQLEVETVRAAAERLPFPGNQFDLVVTESVNVFVADLSRALREYHRVLRPGGFLVDVEMMALGPVSQEWRESAKRVYGAVRVPDQSGWKRAYQDAGFTEVRAIRTRSVRPEDALYGAGVIGDELDLANPEAYQDPRVASVLAANARWMEENHRSLAYGVFSARKPDRSQPAIG